MIDSDRATYVIETFDVSPVDAAYAAGIVDGEGCIVIGQSGQRLTPIVTVSNTDRGVLEWLEQKFGGSIQALARAEPSHKPGWYWSCAGLSRTAALAEALLPYMKVKGAQMLVLSCFYRDRIAYLRTVTKRHAERRPVEYEYKEFIQRMNAA